ncbi:hypothetical protein T484DRAFT_1901868, partial [Baffinella frigidus]
MDEGTDPPLIRLPVHSVSRVGSSLRSRPPVSLPDPHESRSISWLDNEGYVSLERPGAMQAAHMGSGNSHPVARPADYGAEVAAPATHSTVGIILRGRLVTEVLPWGPAHLSGGIEPGDEIVEVDGRGVGDGEEAGDAICEADLIGSSVRLKICETDLVGSRVRLKVVKRLPSGERGEAVVELSRVSRGELGISVQIYAAVSHLRELTNADQGGDRNVGRSLLERAASGVE